MDAIQNRFFFFRLFDPMRTYISDLFLATLNRPVRQRGCDCPGCSNPGDFRAPRSRDNLTNYYWFCLTHVKEYNAKWDYFSGLSASEIEEHIRQATVWERPSWPLGGKAANEKNLRDAFEKAFFSNGNGSNDSANGYGEPNGTPPPFGVGEREALAALELVPPVDFPAIKAQYRLLVKRHHPDANGGSREAEEKFKTLNQAFTLLRALHEEEE